MGVDYIIYASAATDSLTSQDIDDILEVSRRRNKAAELSGMLLFADGGFIQVLEGEKGPLEAAYARILDDPRHTGVQELYRGVAPARQFPDWSMGYHLLDKASLPAGVVDLSADTIRNMKNADVVIHTLFKNFYEAAFRFDLV